jgi:hypothetical protein
MNDITVIDPTAPATGRPARTPWQVRVLAGIVIMLALVTSYGAIYFTFWFEDPEPNLGSWAFVIAFIGINVVSLAAMRGLVRGSTRSHRVLVGFTILGMLWCVAKLVFWQETESLVFGVLNVVCLGLLLAPRTRHHAGL